MKSQLKLLHVGKGSPMHPILREKGAKNYYWDGKSSELIRDWKGYDFILLKIRDYTQIENVVEFCRNLINEIPEGKRPEIIPLAEELTVKELNFLKEYGLYEYFDLDPSNTLSERFACFYKKLEIHCRHQKEFRRIQNQSHALKSDNKDLKRLSLMDDLTGLHNTRYMKEIFESLFDLVHRYDRPLSVFMLDLDHFKDVNDRSDHLIGSTVLKEMGRLLKEQTRKSDIRIRYGGDEFVVIMPETPATSALRVAERVRKAVSELAMTVHADFVVKVTASLGVATLDKARHSAFWELLREADMAMYQAKRKGRNQVCVYDGEVRGYDTTKSSFGTVLKQIVDVDSGPKKKTIPAELGRYLSMIKKGEV